LEHEAWYRVVMPSEPSSGPWLRHQGSILADLFERAANELQEAGIRILIGSLPPTFGETSGAITLHLTPIRYSKNDSTEALELTLRAVSDPEPKRYEVAVGLNGSDPIDALREMIAEHDNIWQELYLGNGLWVSRDGSLNPLQTVAQLSEGDHSDLKIVAGYLHSAFPRSIVEGVMIQGTLYRGLLDEICGARTMSKHFRSLTRRLGGRVPRLQRLVRPMASL
jgi:hypothetical protein